MNYVLLGVLAYGAFCGYLLGLAWKKIKVPKLKNATVFIGAVSTGVPVAFVTGIGDQKWLYPVGLVVGFFWSRIGQALSVMSKGRRPSSRAAWNVALAEVLFIGFGTAILVYLSAHGGEQGELAAEPLTRAEMPCRLAWVYLGRYSNSKRRYELPPAFSYQMSGESRGAIPEVGDKVAITVKRNLIVTGYRIPGKSDKCEQMLSPPENYRPETAKQFIAGSISPGRLVLINQLAFFPSEQSDPLYVWALIGAPEGKYSQ